MLLLLVNEHVKTTVLWNTSKKRARWNAWPFPLRFIHPSQKASQEKRSCKREGMGQKRKMNHTVSSLCHPAYCERHKSEQWCLSGGSLYAHLHWFGSSIHETGTLFIHTLLDQAHRHSLVSNGTWELVENATKPTHPFVWAPAHTCHLPGLAVTMMPMPARALAHRGWGLYVWVGDTSRGTLFVKCRHSHRRQPASIQRCRACKLLCLHAALTILTQMRSDNWGCSLINNIKMEGVSWWLHGPL